MTIVGAQDRDGIAGGDDEGSDHQKYGLSLRASMQSKTTTKAKVGEASVQIAQDSNSQVRHGARQRRLGGAAAAAGGESGAEAPSQGWRPLASIVPVLGLSEDCKAPLRPLGWPAACANRRRGRGFPVHTYRRFRACESAQFFRNTVRRGDAYCSGPLLSIRLRAFSMCERMMLRAPSASCSRIKR